MSSESIKLDISPKVRRQLEMVMKLYALHSFIFFKVFKLFTISPRITKILSMGYPGEWNILWLLPHY